MQLTGTPLPADQEEQALEVMAKAIRNAREISVSAAAAHRLAWAIYNGLLQAGWSLK